MTRSPESPARRRAEAYFTASYEVARRLAEGQGDEAIGVLRKELDRVRESSETVGQRFLLSQIALCHARMGQRDTAREVLEEMEESLPREPDTAILLAEGYLLLLENGERASHHAALALQWAEGAGEATAELNSRAHNLMARALLLGGDLTGAFGAWQTCELPNWRVAVELIEAGYQANEVRRVLVDSLPRHEEHEREQGSVAVATADRIRRLIAWIDAGCPRAR
jgi:tetratricopeptide (TPR) repeat protein